MPQSGKRLIDIIDDEFDYCGKGVAYDKFLLLRCKIESNGQSMDYEDLGWVDRKMVEYDEGHRPNREELEYANVLWKKYK